MPETWDPRPFSSEIKFRVDPTTAQRLREWAQHHLERDPHGGGPHGDEYRTTSLYFDTAAFDVFHRRGSFGRAKYRVRRYGESPILFLERKLKRNGFLHKRRSTIDVTMLPMLHAEAAPPDEWSGSWLRRRVLVRAERPVCEITYIRTARSGITDDGPVRVTIDRDVQARPAQGLRFSMTGGPPALGADCVVEMKFHNEAPALLRRAIEDFRITVTPVSKYRASIESLGLASAGSPAARALHA